MENTIVKSPYYIFMNGGDKMYVLGKTGRYETALYEAMTFTENMMQLFILKNMDIRGLQRSGK